jgi:hypothetical protein
MIESALLCPAGTIRRSLGYAAGCGGWAPINYSR